MSGIPEDLGKLLALLPPGMTLIASKTILQAWFPPDRQLRDLNEQESAVTQAFAARFGCAFHYFPLGGACEEGEGRFHKLAS